jgi:hypothetical protein
MILTESVSDFINCLDSAPQQDIDRYSIFTQFLQQQNNFLCNSNVETKKESATLLDVTGLRIRWTVELFEN